MIYINLFDIDSPPNARLVSVSYTAWFYRPSPLISYSVLYIFYFIRTNKVEIKVSYLWIYFVSSSKLLQQDIFHAFNRAVVSVDRRRRALDVIYDFSIDKSKYGSMAEIFLQICCKIQ